LVRGKQPLGPLRIRETVIFGKRNDLGLSPTNSLGIGSPDRKDRAQLNNLVAAKGLQFPVIKVKILPRRRHDDNFDAVSDRLGQEMLNRLPDRDISVCRNNHRQ
jgi:hypothetical protein